MGFNDDYEQGEAQSEYIAKNYFKYHFKDWSYITNGNKQKELHIDYFAIDKRDKPQFVGIKAEKKYTGNLIYEIWSDVHKKKAGWGPLSKATWLFYYFKSHKLFVINYKKFKSLAETGKFRTARTYKDVYKVSEFKLIPITALVNNLEYGVDLFIYDESRLLCKECQVRDQCVKTCIPVDEYLDKDVRSEYKFAEVLMEPNLLAHIADSKNKLTEQDMLDEIFPEEVHHEEKPEIHIPYHVLTEQEKEVVELYYHEGWNQQQIANKLSLNQSSISRMLSSILKKLHDSMHNCA